MGWNNWVARATSTAALGSLAAAMAIGAFGLAATPAAAQGIAATKHNLGKNSLGTNNKYDGTEEICVFCHTPHGSDTSAAVPLWNRKMASEFVPDGNGDPTTTKTYTTYDQLKTSTLDGTVLSVGSVSLACLSCHDGQTSMSAVINAPGSGGYNTAGAEMTTTGTWNNGITGGLMPARTANSGITNISRDLRDDHPIGVPYAGGKDGANFKDPDFRATNSTSVNDQTVWWVDTAGYSVTVGTTTTSFGGNNSKREKTDMILYTRGTEAYVECASCHDPHTTNTTFLRIPNANSAVCLACHIK